MITPQDVYIAYRKAKSLHSGKGFRLPKEWDEYYATKLSPKNREFLDRATGYFNTTWSNINLDEYMETGSELYKTFSYHMFLKPLILTRYIEIDKLKKRRIVKDMCSIDTTFDYIDELTEYKTRKYLDYTNLQVYCKMKDESQSLLVTDYLTNKIDPLVFVYCLYYKYIKLTDIERQYCYNITNRYRDLLEQMFDVEGYIKQREGI